MNYKTRQVMFSSKDSGARTPQALFDQLDAEFHFNRDVCADPAYPLSPNLIQSFGQEGLRISWKESTCYMNPPYKRTILDLWLEKASEESENYRGTADRVTVVALIPGRTDTKWFWKYILEPHFQDPRLREIRPIKGRVRFSNYPTGAPFPSMIVVFR